MRKLRRGAKLCTLSSSKFRNRRGAIEQLREYDQSAEITVVSEEPHLIYSRPLLSHYLSGDIDRSRLAFRGSDFYTRHHVHTVLEDAVTTINPHDHSVLTASGRILHYDQ